MIDESWKAVAKQIDECKYLYMRALHEPRDNEIRFVVEEAGLQAPPIGTGEEDPYGIPRSLLTHSPSDRTLRHDYLRSSITTTRPSQCRTNPIASIPNLQSFLQGNCSECSAGPICWR
jgi:hypothetical protein